MFRQSCLARPGNEPHVVTTYNPQNKTVTTILTPKNGKPRKVIDKLPVRKLLAIADHICFRKITDAELKLLVAINQAKEVIQELRGS